MSRDVEEDNHKKTTGAPIGRFTQKYQRLETFLGKCAPDQGANNGRHLICVSLLSQKAEGRIPGNEGKGRVIHIKRKEEDQKKPFGTLGGSGLGHVYMNTPIQNPMTMGRCGGAAT